MTSCFPVDERVERVKWMAVPLYEGVERRKRETMELMGPGMRKRVAEVFGDREKVGS